MWRLQRGTDRDCIVFRRFAESAHYPKAGSTRQGIYICTPQGELLGSANSLNAEEVLKLLDDALGQWRELPDARRRSSPDDQITPVHRWEQSFPENGLVLVQTKRDLASDAACGRALDGYWNRDYVWYSADEARDWLPAEHAVGATRQLPRRVVERLARFHLVDSVRGQTTPFASAEVADSWIRTTVESVEGDRLGLRIEGSIAAQAEGPWLMQPSTWTPQAENAHRITSRLLGYATFDRSAARFVDFELLALGCREGFTANNGRREDTPVSRIGFHFELIAKEASPSVAPAFIDVYNASWVKHPPIDRTK